MWLCNYLFTRTLSLSISFSAIIFCFFFCLRLLLHYLLVKKYSKTITRHTIWTWEFIYWMTKSFNSIFQMFYSQLNDSLLASTFLFIVCFHFIIFLYFISTLLIAIGFFCLKKKESHNLFNSSLHSIHFLIPCLSLNSSIHLFACRKRKQLMKIKAIIRKVSSDVWFIHKKRQQSGVRMCCVSLNTIWRTYGQLTVDKMYRYTTGTNVSAGLTLISFTEE